MTTVRTEPVAGKQEFHLVHEAPAHRRQWAFLMVLLVTADALVVYTSLSLAFFVRIGSGLLAYTARYDPATYREFAIINVAVWLALFYGMGLYRRDALFGGVGEYQQVIRACTVGVLFIITLSFFWRGALEVSRGWLLLSWGFSCTLVCAERCLVRRLGYALRRRGWLTSRVLIVGANSQGAAIAEQWRRSRSSGMAVTGFVDDFKPVGSPVVGGLKVLGRASALEALAHELRVQEIVVVSGAIAWETFEEVIERASRPNGCTVRLSPGFYEMLATGVSVTNKTFVPLLTINERRLVGTDAVLKWVLDHGLGALLCLPALPIMGILALGLKLSRSGRPVLDHHRVAGIGGSTFGMLKFHTGTLRPALRTLRSKAPGERQPARESDPARPPTWLERKLLSSGLDKLPQLFNVLAGQMSLVGPRPRVVGADDDDVRTAWNLQVVNPGMIGPWTASGAWVAGGEGQSELYYVRNWTIWLDLQILLQTFLSWLRVGRAASPVQDGDRAVAGRPEGDPEGAVPVAAEATGSPDAATR
jgi:lipopolysaccharide/colanic/teichoic acid biosynthesis glycosyltransferase